MPAPPATTEKRALRTAPAPRVTRSASAAPARRNRGRGARARHEGGAWRSRAGPCGGNSVFPPAVWEGGKLIPRYGASFFPSTPLAFASHQVSVVLFAVLDAAE